MARAGPDGKRKHRRMVIGRIDQCASNCRLNYRLSVSKVGRLSNIFLI